MEPIIEFFVKVFSAAFIIWLFAEWLYWGLKKDVHEWEDYIDSYLPKEDERDE